MNKTKVSDLTQDLFQLFKQFSRVRWARKSHIGFKRSEYELLVILAFNLDADRKTMTVTDLSNLLRITPAGVTHLINPLEEAGCIERLQDPDDRRVVLIGLTDKGNEIAEKHFEKFHEKVKDLVDYLGEEDSKTLIRLMSSVIDYFSSQHKKSIS